MVKRLCLLLTVFAAGCSYSPKFDNVDCKVKCSTKGTCPEALACKNGWCRPKEATGACDCEPNAQRPCGGGMGICNAGVQTCTNNRSWGACVGEGKPTAEVCDNKDNDCNGSVDDAITDAPACPKSKGVCMNTRQKCVGGQYSGTCDPADYGPLFEEVETKCDGEDNDCDGFADGTPQAIIMTNVSEFVFVEYDGGFSIVGVEEPSTGGYQLVVQRLTPTLQKRGAADLISPPAAPGTTGPMTLAARVNPAGTTFVAWTERQAGVGVKLSSVESSGIVSTFPTYVNAERQANIPLSLGVSATKVYVSWPAKQGSPPGSTSIYNQTARLVTWDLNDGGIATTDFFNGGDGGFNPWIDIYHARVSPTGKVMGIRGYENDGGTSIATTFELAGPRISNQGLGSRYQFVELGNVVSSGWSYNSPSFFPLLFPDTSGFEYRSDVLSNNAIVSFKKQNDLKITTGNVGRGNNAVLVSWTEDHKAGTIGTVTANGGGTRTRNVLPPNGGLMGELQQAHPGGTANFIGVVWRDSTTGPGNIYGQMICQP